MVRGLPLRVLLGLLCVAWPVEGRLNQAHLKNGRAGLDRRQEALNTTSWFEESPELSKGAAALAPDHLDILKRFFKGVNPGHIDRAILEGIDFRIDSTASISMATAIAKHLGWLESIGSGTEKHSTWWYYRACVYRLHEVDHDDCFKPCGEETPLETPPEDDKTGFCYEGRSFKGGALLTSVAMNALDPERESFGITTVRHLLKRNGEVDKDGTHVMTGWRRPDEEQVLWKSFRRLRLVRADALLMHNCNVRELQCEMFKHGTSLAFTDTQNRMKALCSDCIHETMQKLEALESSEATPTDLAEISADFTKWSTALNCATQEGFPSCLPMDVYVMYKCKIEGEDSKECSKMRDMEEVDGPSCVTKTNDSRNVHVRKWCECTVGGDGTDCKHPKQGVERKQVCIAHGCQCADGWHGIFCDIKQHTDPEKSCQKGNFLMLNDVDITGPKEKLCANVVYAPGTTRVGSPAWADGVQTESQRIQQMWIWAIMDRKLVSANRLSVAYVKDDPPALPSNSFVKCEDRLFPASVGANSRGEGNTLHKSLNEYILSSFKGGTIKTPKNLFKKAISKPRADQHNKVIVHGANCLFLPDVSSELFGWLRDIQRDEHKNVCNRFAVPALRLADLKRSGGVDDDESRRNPPNPTNPCYCHNGLEIRRHYMGNERDERNVDKDNKVIDYSDHIIRCDSLNPPDVGITELGYVENSAASTEWFKVLSDKYGQDLGVARQLSDDVEKTGGICAPGFQPYMKLKSKAAA